MSVKKGQWIEPAGPLPCCCFYHMYCCGVVPAVDLWESPGRKVRRKSLIRPAGIQRANKGQTMQAVPGKLLLLLLILLQPSEISHVFQVNDSLRHYIRHRNYRTSNAPRVPSCACVQKITEEALNARRTSGRLQMVDC